MNLKHFRIRLISMLSDERAYLKRFYKKRTHRTLNLDNPITFNDKIQWLKLNHRNSNYTICADKYEVREYVKKHLGEGVLNELYGCFDSPDQINFEALPNRFVMKVTHGSGQNLIVKDKSTVDWPLAAKWFHHYLNNNHYYSGKEWAYKNIKPRIVCERYLEDEGKPPDDYKFFCFNGKPVFIQLDFDRFDSHRRNFYDLDWKLLPFLLNHENNNQGISKPEGFETMLEYAEKLAQDFPFARIDFYNIKGKIYFGEITFYPGNGTSLFTPDEYNEKIGSYMRLPN